MNYVPLRVCTHYSILQSIIKPKALLDFCKTNNIPQVALTDHNNLFACAEYSFYSTDIGYPGIVGCSITTNQGVITLFCKDQHGYKNLCNIISDFYIKYDQKYPLEQIKEFSQGLICITGNVDGVLQQNAQKNLKILLEAFHDDFFLELNRTNGKSAQEYDIGRLSQEHNIPVVGTSVAYFLNNEQSTAFQVMQAIGNNEIIADENKTDSVAGKLLTNEEMYERFKDCPIVLENTLALARKCTFLLHQQKPKFAAFDEDEVALLKKWATQGLNELFESQSWYENIKDQYDSKEHAIQVYKERFDYEMEMIIKLGFAGYFLIVADFVSWAREQGISLSARGSGAGSLVALTLKIIVIDPIHFGLFFERFINPGRVNLPDFDIDFCQERRQEVINYVTEKYSKEFVAHIITFGIWHARGVLRDVGRALNIPYRVVDGLCKLIPNKPNHSLTLSESLEEDATLKHEYDTDAKIHKMFDIAMILEGNNRNTGIHAAGIVIGYDKLQDIVPLYWTKDMQLPATSYTMKYIEQASLVKFDFLGLTALTIIDKVMLAIKDKIDIQKIPQQDPKIFELLCKGLTAGIFQFESAGLTKTIMKQQPSTLEELIAIISLYRPGPMENIDQFISNKNKPEQIEYVFDEMHDILKETFGIIVYQEQVLNLAKTLADYTLSEADLLRRAMGKKIPKEMAEQREKFTCNTVSKMLLKQFKIERKFTVDEIEKGLFDTKNNEYEDNHTVSDNFDDKNEPDKDIVFDTSENDLKQNAALLDPQSNLNTLAHKDLSEKTEHHTLESMDGNNTVNNNITTDINSMQSSHVSDVKTPIYTKLTQEHIEFIKDTYHKASDLFDQIVKFSGYAFNKAHAASHAFIGYQTAYLKTYYPLEFMSMSLTMEQDKHDKVALLANELPALNITLLKPDVNHSSDIFERKPPHEMYFSLSCIKSIGNQLAQEIVQARQGGRFTSVENLCQRVRLSNTTIEALIYSGALDNLPIYDNQTESKDIVRHRSDLIHEVDSLLNQNGMGIFGNINTNQQMISTQQILINEFKYMGVILNLQLLKEIISKKVEVICSKDVKKAKSKEIYVSGLLLGRQVIKTRKNTVQYILQMADTGSVFEVFVDSEMFDNANISIGDIVICQILVRNQYWICEKLFPQTRHIKQLIINVHQRGELPVIKTFTSSLIPGSTKCSIKIHTNPVKIMELEAYHITTQHLNQLDDLNLTYELEE